MVLMLWLYVGMCVVLILVSLIVLVVGFLKLVMMCSIVVLFELDGLSMEKNLLLVMLRLMLLMVIIGGWFVNFLCRLCSWMVGVEGLDMG